MPDIFDEVQDDLRADRARRLLLRYGGLIAGLLVAVVAGVGGYEIWQRHVASGNARMADRYIAAVQAAEGPTGLAREGAGAELDSIIARGGSGYRTLARLRRAALLSEAGDRAGASAFWDQVSGDGAADPSLRDVANLQWALHNLDNADPTAVRTRLQPLTAPASPWHGLALEAQALLDIRQHHADAARDTLRLLAQDTSAPEGVRRRAGGLLDQLGPSEATSKAGG